MSYIPEPVTRTDKYLAYIAGNMDVALPDHPITRKEHYLAAWAEKSGFEDVDVAGEPPLTLENAIGKPLKGLRIYGKSTQVTTTGAQLLEKNIVVHPPNGEVSSIVLFEGELSGTYTVSCELEGEVQYPTRAALEIIVDGVDKFCLVNDHTVVTGMITKITCFAQNTYCDFTGTLNIMLNAGDTHLPWEPYTGGQPSPSPEYPREIESVGMKWSTGANLLDTINTKSSTTKTTWLIQQNGYSIAAQGTYAEKDPNAYKNIRIELDPAIVAGKKITASVEQAENDAGELPTSICDINYTKQSGKKTYWNNFGVNNPITITIPEDIASVSCRIHIIENKEETAEYGTYTTTVKGLMVSIGDKVLPWEPYTGGVPKPYGDKIGVNVRGKNLIPFPYPELGGAGTQTEKEGVKYTVQGDGGIRCTGTPSSQFGVIITRIAYSATALSSSNPSNGKIVLSGGELYFDPKNNALFIYYNPSQVDKPLDTVFYPQIELGTVATPYEPYREPQSMSISVPNGLPGIQVASGGNYTDADGRQWICDEVDFARGVYVQRVWKGVFDGSDDERWEIYNNTTYAGFYLTNVFAEKLTMRDGIANTYKVDNSYIPIEAVWIGVNEKAIYIKNSRFYDDTLSDKGLSNFKDSLAAHPMVVMTYLDSPIETPLTSDQLAAYKQLYTYKGTTIIDNDAGAYMSVRYEKMK